MACLSTVLALALACLAAAQETTGDYTTTPAPTTMPTVGPSTTTPRPCWSDAFPNITRTDAGNDLTCQVCTVIFQGLDDYLLNNEEQIAHAMENLCTSIPWLFEVSN
jgi:hypothetical protein